MRERAESSSSFICWMTWCRRSVCGTTAFDPLQSFAPHLMMPVVQRMLPVEGRAQEAAWGPKRTLVMRLDGNGADAEFGLSPYCVVALDRRKPLAATPRLPRAARHLRSAEDAARSRQRHIARHRASSREATHRRWHAETISKLESGCPPGRP